jgi:hypothetical protein
MLCTVRLVDIIDRCKAGLAIEHSAQRSAEEAERIVKHEKRAG